MSTSLTPVKTQTTWNDAAAAINDGYRYDLTFGYDFDRNDVEVKPFLIHGENPIGRTTPRKINFIINHLQRLSEKGFTNVA